MNRKWISILLVCMLVAACAALAACQEGGNNVTTACTLHSDANADGVCDNCGVRVGAADNSSSQAKPVDVKISVRNNYDKPMEGAIVNLKDVDGSIFNATANQDGMCTITLDPGQYSVWVDNLPENHISGGSISLEVKEGMQIVKMETIDNTPNGTEEKPFFLGDEKANYHFAANETFHFRARTSAVRAVVIDNPNVEVRYNNEVVQPNAEGRVEIRVELENAGDTISFTVTNKLSEELDLELGLVSDPGTQDNPYEAKLNELTLVEIKDNGTVCYLWVVPEDFAEGTLTITSGSDKNSINLYNLTTSRVTNFTEGQASVSLDKIHAGDSILISVTVTTGAGDGTHTIDFTLTYEEAEAK